MDYPYDTAVALELVVNVKQYEHLVTGCSKRSLQTCGSRLSPRRSRQIACVLFFVMCLLWSQLLYPLALKSKTLFEAIIDGKDQAASDPTYNKWLLGLFSDEVRRYFSVFRARYFSRCRIEQNGSRQS